MFNSTQRYKYKYHSLNDRIGVICDLCKFMTEKSTSYEKLPHPQICEFCGDPITPKEELSSEEICVVDSPYIDPIQGFFRNFSPNCIGGSK